MLESKLLKINPETVRKADLKFESQDLMPSIIADDRQGQPYVRLHSSAKTNISFISRLNNIHN